MAIIRNNECLLDHYEMRFHNLNYRQIIEKAAIYVKEYIRSNNNLNLLYHRLVHSENVVTAVTKLAEHYKLNERDFFICIIAAWFHDIGYYEDILNHEQVSAKKAEEFLVINGVDEETTTSIKNCILATKFPQAPTNLLEEIVCDANLYHLGTDDFFNQNKMMRKEAEALHHLQINKDEWRNGIILLMENHHYHTAYCKRLLNKKKKENLEKLKKQADGHASHINPMDALLRSYIANGQQIEDKGKNRVPDQPERGTETLFRIASAIGQRLNEQADTKAHILISVNTIIISVFIAVILRKAEVHSYLTLAVVMFLTVNLLTIVFSVLSTRPTVPKGVFHQEEIENKKVNLIFFGNFYKMNFNDYSKGMLEVIGDKNFLYITLIKNLYEQGVMLGNKYRLLKIAYNVFMFGIVVSVVTFFIAYKYLDD